MKPRFVWKLFPIFYKASWDAWGHQKGPVIYLPETYSRALIPHEVFHIKQYYAGLLVVLALSLALAQLSVYAPAAVVLAYGILIRTRWYRFRIEAAAYGESVRIMGEDTADRYAAALASDNYGLGKSHEDCRVQILKRSKDGRLF